MHKTLFLRSMGLALALMLMVSALPVTALAAETPASNFTELVATDVTLDETQFEYTGSEIRPNVTVRVHGTLLTLDKDYQLEYADNIEPGTAKVIVTGIATSGYTGTVEHPFYISERADNPDETPEEIPGEPEYPLVEILHEHVTINGKEFTYTGEAIEPEITVTIDGKVLTQGKDYSLKYEDNIQPGTGIAVVSGIATATQTGGYTGEVRIRFTIRPMTEETYPLVEILASHVTLEDTAFRYTGKAIEPKVTVTIDGKVLTEGQDYSVKYENNVKVGTGTAIISGIATATQTGGYTGEVKVDFTIEHAYKITKGNGAKWYQESSKNLSFTADGAYEDFTGLSINGKLVSTAYYTVKEGSTVVTLKNSFLKKLDLGDYTITLHFTDGDAAGTFQVTDGLDTTNPATGDTIGVFAAVLFLSLTALSGMAYTACKKTGK